MALQTTGLEFFYLSVDFFDNDKVLLVEQEYGSRATLLAIKLLSKIYHEGYYYKWGKDECLLFTRRLPSDYTAEYVQQVIDELLVRGFFHKECYDQYGILTSGSIQLHYFEAVQRRKLVEVERDYLLVDTAKYKNIHIAGEEDIPAAGDPLNGVQPVLGEGESYPEPEKEKGTNGAGADIFSCDVDRTSPHAYISEQNKEKESKLKVEESKYPPSDPPGGKVRTMEEVLSFIPQDGVKRNCRGLIENLQLFGVKQDEIVRLVSYCNYGVIGHPIWQAIADIRNAGGKIQQPVRFIWSRLRKGG